MVHMRQASLATEADLSAYTVRETTFDDLVLDHTRGRSTHTVAEWEAYEERPTLADLVAKAEQHEQECTLIQKQVTEEQAAGTGPMANGHRWPCPGFYTGNHNQELRSWTCTCGADKERVMADLVDPEEIEGIVGIERHPTRHYARAVSEQQKVYILHSMHCVANVPNLLDCLYSLALVDEGIDLGYWEGYEDQPVWVRVDEGRLLPHPAQEESAEVAIRRAAMARCQERHPEVQSSVTGFMTPDGFVAACASCQAEVIDEQQEQANTLADLMVEAYQRGKRQGRREAEGGD